MQFPYFGTVPTVTTLTQAAGTRREIVDFLAQGLATAGWTYVSGSGTGTPKLQAAATPHGLLRPKVAMSDTNDATNASVKFLDTSEASSCAYGFLAPAVGKVWRLFASPYWFYIAQDIATVSNFDCIYLFQLFIPAPWRGLITESFFSGGDQGGNANQGLRTSLGQNNTSNNGQLFGFNTTRYSPSLPNQNSSGNMCTIARGPISGSGLNGATGKQWYDGTLNITDAEISWGLTDYNAVGFSRGVLPDSFLYAGTPAYGTQFVIDGHTWFCVSCASSSGWSLFLLMA